MARPAAKEPMTNKSIYGPKRLLDQPNLSERVVSLLEKETVVELKPPKCSSCGHMEIRDPGKSIWRKCKVLNEEITHERTIFVNQCGCLFHPNSRGYINKSLIEKLERKVKSFEKDYVPSSEKNKLISRVMINCDRQFISFLKGGGSP
jgi:hypothetical protein